VIREIKFYTMSSFTLKAGDISLVTAESAASNINVQVCPWHQFLINFAGKYTCITTDCISTTFSSTHASMKLHVRSTAKKEYEIVVQFFRKVCKNCKMLCDIQLNLDLDDEIFDRVVPFMALQVAHLMKKDN
jgi:hypothetical protein